MQMRCWLCLEVLLKSLSWRQFFGIFAVSRISTVYDNKVYATDSSVNKVAVTALDVGQETSETLCQLDRKGAYTLLDNPARQNLRSLGSRCS